MNYRAIAVLRLVVRNTFASLPRSVLKSLGSCRVYLSDLGYNAAGEKLLGLARKDGAVVLLDRSTVVQHADDPGFLEDVLAHELGHVWRTRTGRHSEDEAREELETNRVLKSWGFRDAKARRRAAAR